MIKVLIVDDEKLILDGMSKIVSNYSSEYSVCGLARDGVEAIELIKREIPHIVITDIKMPRMDGIELLKWVKENVPSINCVVFTSYDEIEYLHEALKNRAFDYLLKPVKKKVLYNVLDEIASKIRDENFMLKKRAFIDNSYRQNFYKDLLYSDTPDTRQIDTFYKDSDDDFAKSGKKLILSVKNTLANNSEIKTEEDISLINYGIKNIFDEMLERAGISYVSLFGSHKIINYIIKPGDVADIKIILEGICQKIEEVIEQKISVGMSLEFELMQECYQERLNSQTALQTRIVQGPGVYKLIPERDGYKEKLFEYSRRLADAAEKLDRAKCEKIVNECIADIKEQCCTPMLINRFLEDFEYRIKIYINQKHLSLTSETQQLLQVNFLDIESTEDLKRVLLGISTAIIEETEKLLENNTSKKVYEAKKYINRYYYKNITLIELAQELDMSPNYLSKQFKEETGENFIDYITRVRIDAAKVILRENDIAIKDVSELVGYENSTYFNKVFKKMVGMSPGNYREKMIR